MILKHAESVLLYFDEPKVSEYEILIKYNPTIINKKIYSLQEQINESYHLNVSHTVCDEVSGVISVSYPLEKLVIWIIQKQDDLDRFKKNSVIRMNLLKQILREYTKQEQKEVMDYMRSNGRIKAYETIDKLQKDLYKFKYSNSNNSAKKHSKATVV
ncbi:spore coat protein [Staphylococcus xylosus]|uniref:spore coat protein n=1 Tax=Staphylococcus xylosus TaxID=1288 RepID=UPI001F319C94|nr:spore coat protein [Staphylococcus xylosus]MCE4994718.1 spore coat protein [Staphylococcus xylosus]